MKIAVDVMGGDRGCEVIIDGLMQALKKCQQIETIQIVGNEIEISQSGKKMYIEISI